jgi:hypothetical protein
MLKISVVEGPRRCRLVLEGMLIEPWIAEVISEYTKAKGHLDGRELVINITNLSAVSPAGDSAILLLLDDNAKFQSGVFMKEVLKQLASRRQPK